MFPITAKLIKTPPISKTQTIIQKFSFDRKQSGLLLAAILINATIAMYFEV